MTKSKLKTLKDLEDLMVIYNFKGSEAFGHKIIATKIVREEAIKWVKEWRKKQDRLKNKNGDMWFFNEGKIVATMTINNITEDDLK